MVKPYQGGQNVDGMKPIGQTMPPQAQQFAPDNAQPLIICLIWTMRFHFNIWLRK
jgi:hypothetical protein